MEKKKCILLLFFLSFFHSMSVYSYPPLSCPVSLSEERLNELWSVAQQQADENQENFFYTTVGQEVLETAGSSLEIQDEYDFNDGTYGDDCQLAQNHNKGK